MTSLITQYNEARERSDESRQALTGSSDPTPEEAQLLDEIRQDEAAQARQREIRGNLWYAYVLAVLLAPVGLCYAIYMAVAEKMAPVRRHAIGVAAVSILSIVVSVLVYTMVIAPSADASRVTGDLKSLLDSHSVAYTDVSCTHQSGNSWGCFVTINGQQQFAQITDDGHSIYEQGIAAP